MSRLDSRPKCRSEADLRDGRGVPRVRVRKGRVSMNVPMFLTLVRVLLVPVFMVVVSVRWEYGGVLAATVFTVAAITDGLDGAIARRFNQVTDAGKLLDPLADKLMVTAALIALVELRAVPAWVAVVIIGREFAVSGIRMMALVRGEVVPASRLGKTKTALQVIAIIALLIRLPGSPVLLALAVVLTIGSGADYFLRAQNLWRR